MGFPGLDRVTGGQHGIREEGELPTMPVDTHNIEMHRLTCLDLEDDLLVRLNRGTGFRQKLLANGSILGPTAIESPVHERCLDEKRQQRHDTHHEQWKSADKYNQRDALAAGLKIGKIRLSFRAHSPGTPQVMQFEANTRLPVIQSTATKRKDRQLADLVDVVVLSSSS